jgi:hypothetical protein
MLALGYEGNCALRLKEDNGCENCESRGNENMEREMLRKEKP